MITATNGRMLIISNIVNPMPTFSALASTSSGLVVAFLILTRPVYAQHNSVPAPAPPSNSVAPEREWFPTPSILPSGGKLAVVSGNPFGAGTFTLEFNMPDGYTIPPHTNPSSERVQVQSGALIVGVGRKIDRRKSIELHVGDTTTAPAGVPHWSIARGETRLTITEASGPYGIAYMSVRDEPGGHAFPNGYTH